MANEYTALMRDIEQRFKKATQLTNRSEYKIYYCQIRPAPVLILGKNPGGSPEQTSPDGCINFNNGTRASSSAGYFENDEHDVLDCGWPENTGLRKLLFPLFSDNRDRIRRDVVKTNVAFQRSKSIVREQRSFETTCAPYLNEILAIVRPKLVLLTGPDISEFSSRFAIKQTTVINRITDSNVKQTVFAAARFHLRQTLEETFVVQLAHASQFSWTYERYGVVDKIQSLLADEEK
jgi:hypothetical protein